MAVVLSIGFFCFVMSLVAWAGYALWVRTGEPATKASSAELFAALRQAAPRSEQPRWLRSLIFLGSMAPAPAAAYEKAARDIVSAGYRHESAVAVFYGLKAVLAVAFPSALAALLFALRGNFLWGAPALVLSAWMGARIPDWLLRRRLAKRKIKVNRGLPDFLDLLMIAVDSGLSLEQALADTASDLKPAHPVLSEELAIFRFEVQAGASRAEALRNLGERTREPEMRKLASLLVQADRHGSGVSEVLRTQARYMRIRRRQRAEELAHQVSVKLIFPIFLLIMPTMFLVTAGPAILFLINNLGGLT